MPEPKRNNGQLPTLQHVNTIQNPPYTPPQDGGQYLLLSTQPLQMHTILNDSLFIVIGDTLFINAYPDTTTTRLDHIQLIATVAQAKGYMEIMTWLDLHNEPLGTWAFRFICN